MKCKKCGAEVEKSDIFCGTCGEKIIIEDVEPKEIMDEKMKECFNGTTSQKMYGQNERNDVNFELKENRNALAIMLLSLVTCGIYGIYYYSTVIRDVNFICVEDGEKTQGLVKLVLLNIITFGIYGIYWHYKVCTRALNYQNTHQNEVDINIKPALSGGAYLLWALLGSLLFGAGSIVAFCLFTRNMNNVSKIYNRTNARSDRPIPEVDKKPIIIISIILAVIIALTTVSSVALSNLFNDTDIAIESEDVAEEEPEETSESEKTTDNEPGETYETDYYSITLPAAFKDCDIITSDIENGYGYACVVTNKDGDRMVCAVDLVPEESEEGHANIEGMNAEAVGTMEVTRVNGFIIYVYYWEESEYEYDYIPELKELSYDDYLIALGELVYSMTMTGDSGEISFY